MLAVSTVVIAPAIKVQVQDAFGNLVLTATDSITLAINNNPGSGTLSGTLVVAAVSGEATFGDISIDKVGTGYTLDATAGGLSTATTASFDITLGAATKLGFSVEPVDTAPGATITPAIKVQVQDAGGNLVAAATDSITLAIGANPGLGTLSGTLVVAAVSGETTFSDISIDNVGSGYTLTATAGGLTGATSAIFNIIVADLVQIHYRWRNDDGGEFFDTGSGADGALTPTGTFNLNTDFTGGRSYADGIAYRVVTPSDGASSVTRFNGADTLSNGLVAGDEVLLINMQGASGDTADVGIYEFTEVLSVTASTITFTGSITKSYDGTTASNQSVVVQRVPNYTSVTLDSTDSITASAWDGLTTTPTGSAGYLTGVVVFRATGTVSVGATASITVNNLGYTGGAGGVGGVNDSGTADGGDNGESYDGTVGSGGDDTLGAICCGNLGTEGGGTATNKNAVSPEGTRGGGGGGGNADAVGTDGAGGGGGGGYGGAGGGGGGGADVGGNTGGAGGNGGTDDSVGGGGGGEGADGANGSAGGNAGSAGGGSPSAAAGTTPDKTGQGGGGSGESSGGVGAGGGGGGGTYSDVTLATILLGSGGGGGGSHDNTPDTGADGGDGGGIIFIIADTVSVSGTISGNGGTGATVVSKAGSGGGGAGGSILIQVNTATLGTGVTATGGSKGGNTDLGGGGGQGGVGRIRVEADSITGTATPTASTTGTPNTAATFAAAEDTLLLALANNTPKRLRFEISNEGTDSSSAITYLLEVSDPNPASCSVGVFSAVPTGATGHWQVVDSGNLTDGNATMNVASGLTDENTTFVPGEVKDTGNQTGGITLSITEFTEIEFAVQATANAANGGLYCFRLTNAGATTNFTFTQHAQVTVGGVDNFLVEAVGGGSIATQTAGSPFNIKITARDFLNNTVTGFSGTADITSTGNLSAGGVTTVAFTNGVCWLRTV